jgi:hypothetical protein
VSELRGYDAAMSGLPPTVVGALIAGGAAVIGFGASALTNTATLRSNRRQARDQLLWEKKTELYDAMFKAATEERSSWDTLTEQDIDTIMKRLSRLIELESGAWLYASAGVMQRLYDYEGALGRLSRCDDRPPKQYVLDEYVGRRRLVGALRHDVQGMENPLLRERIHRLYEPWLRVRAVRLARQVSLADEAPAAAADQDVGDR